MDYGRLIVATVAGALAGALGSVLSAFIKTHAKLGPQAQRGLIIGLAAGLATSAAQYTPLTDWVSLELKLKSSLELHMAREGRRLLNDARFRAATEHKDGYEVSVLAAKLAHDGMQYLDDADLDTWLSIRVMLAQQSQPVCAGLWKGSLSSDEVERALSQLPEPQIKAWSRLSIDASMRALEADSEPRDQQTLDEGLTEILAALPPMEQVRTREDMRLKDVDDTRACELMRLVLRGSQSLPPPLRYPFLRALSQV